MNSLEFKKSNKEVSMDFFESIRATLETILNVARETAEAAAKKSKETAKVIRLKLEIEQYRRQMVRYITDLGTKVYELSQSGEEPNIFQDERVKELLELIDDMKGTIEELESKLEKEKRGV